MKVNKNNLLQISLIILIVLAVIGFSVAIFNLLQPSSNSNNSSENSASSSNTTNSPEANNGSTNPDPSNGSTNPDPNNGSTNPDPNNGSSDPNSTSNTEVSNPLNGQTNPEYTTLTQEQRYTLLEDTLSTSGYDAANSLLADLVASTSSAAEQSDLCRLLASLLYLSGDETYNSRILELAYVAESVNPTYTTAASIANYEAHIGSSERAEEYTRIARERMPADFSDAPIKEFYDNEENE